MLIKFKNSRTKTKAKLLTLGALLFSLGVATSAVATSAWYSLLDIAVVSNLNLQINLNGENWLKLELDPGNGEDLIESGETGFTKEQLGITQETKLTDVSGMFESAWRNTSDVPLFHTRYTPGYSQESIKNHKDRFEPVEHKNKTYFQNVFYLSAGMETDVYLDGTSSIKSNGKANRETAEKNHWSEDRLKNLAEVEKAARVSFLVDDNYFIAKNEKEDTYYGGVLDINNDGYYDSYGGKELLYGEYGGEPEYLGVPGGTPLTEDELQPFKDNRSVFEAVHKEDVNQVNVNSVEITKENSINIDNLILDVDNPLKDVTRLCHVSKGEKKRIVVSIYVEGWDKHMTDDIAYASFDVNIAFTGLVKD